MYCVYIIFSEKLNRFYIGTTDDFERRFNEHNSASYQNAFTSKGIPWTRFCLIDGLSSSQARKLEVHLKKMRSAKYYNNLITIPGLIDKLKLRFA